MTEGGFDYCLKIMSKILKRSERFFDGVTESHEEQLITLIRKQFSNKKYLETHGLWHSFKKLSKTILEGELLIFGVIYDKVHDLDMTDYGKAVVINTYINPVGNKIILTLNSIINELYICLKSDLYHQDVIDKCTSSDLYIKYKKE